MTGQSAEIKITLTPDGQLNVNGPIAEKLLCFGMLEMAKKIISDYQPSQIIAPTVMIKPLNNGS